MKRYKEDSFALPESVENKERKRVGSNGMLIDGSYG